jgi:hypothetical protein
MEGGLADDPGHLDPADSGHSPFMPRPFCVYEGHSADLLDIAWSKVRSQKLMQTVLSFLVRCYLIHQDKFFDKTNCVYHCERQ